MSPDPFDFSVRAQWTVEWDAKDVRVLVDGQEAVRAQHGLSETVYSLSIEGHAKVDVPEGARVLFDNFRVEPLGGGK